MSHCSNKKYLHAFIMLIIRNGQSMLTICRTNLYIGYIPAGKPTQKSDTTLVVKHDIACKTPICYPPSFLGLQKKSVPPEITPIKTDGEYLDVINRLADSKTLSGDLYWNLDENLKDYPNANICEYGLLPYVGHHDKSCDINRYLSGRLSVTDIINNPSKHSSDYKKIPTEQTLRNMVRALDYSLDKIDSEFGKYEGIVYRNGFMGMNEGQYFSTSKNPTLIDKMDFDSGEILGEYSVIRTKSGHKIFDFQKKMDDTFAEEE